MREAVITPLHIELNSKMGGPVFERTPDKLRLLRDDYFPRMLAGDVSFLEGLYTIVNVRLQPEKLTKIREVPVLSSDGNYYEMKIEGVTRTTSLGDGTFAARARPVYNPNVANNFKQVVDNALHNVFLTYDAFHHDLYKWRETGRLLPGHARAIDVKHFERCIGALVGLRSKFIGERYDFYQQLILSQPYLCVSDDWKTPFFVTPAPGFNAQLASGDSSVATIAKEVLTILYADFFARKWSLTDEAAIDMALKGGDPARIAFLNYGDDNLLYGESSSQIDECVNHLSKFLTIQAEEPGLIGWKYDPKTGFALRDQSFVVNFWKPERAPGPPFRPFFFLGLYLRTQTFEKYGSDNIPEMVEDMWDLLTTWGISRDAVNKLAEHEAHLAGTRGLPLNYLLGKQYLLSDEEREALGQSKHIGLGLTNSIFNNLVHSRYKKG
jgi:hypothetical protein